jgi:predicted Rossmann-fold nucleotide-binding protein
MAITARIFIAGAIGAKVDSLNYELAKTIGKELASRGFTIVSGAYMGISDAAFSGAISGNENSKRLALACDEIEMQRNAHYSDIIVADNFFDMKMKSCINSDAFIFLPGCFGTLSMLFVVLQLKQLKLMGKKPVICVGEVLEEMFNNLSFYNSDILEFYHNGIFVRTADEVIKEIEKFFSV